MSKNGRAKLPLAKLIKEWRKRKTRFSVRLRRMREARELSRHELAYRAGLDYSTICKLETAQRGPTTGNVTLLSKALRVKPEELLTDET